MIIGEKQSELVNLDKVIGVGHDLYADTVDWLRDKPLDTGRLLYVMLRRAIPEEFGVEVWWNHFTNEVTLLVNKEPWEMTMDFVDPVMARSDLITYLEQLVDNLKERASSLQ